MLNVRSVVRIAALAAFSFVAPVTASAQFNGTPSFQVPRVSERDFNFAVADADGTGTTLLFQWREGVGSWTHLVFDAGLADPGGRGDVRLVLGGGFGYWFYSSNDELPLDMMVTGGIGGSFGDGLSLIRVPFGLSVGHRFVLDAPIAVTPYAHPRLALDYCSKCGGGGDSDTDLSVDVDLGVDVEISRSVALRASILLSGSDFASDDAFGVSLVWTPRGLR